MNERIGEGTYLYGGGELKNLRLSKSARELLREDFSKLPGNRSLVWRQWEKYLKGQLPNIQITFDQSVAGEIPNVQFVTTVHPLTKQAAAYFRQAKPVYVAFSCNSDDIPSGTYYFRTYLWKYYGENAKTRIQVVCNDKRVSSAWNELVMNGLQIEDISNYSEDNVWNSLEKKHLEMWREEKSRHIQDVKAVIDLHISSLKNSYNVKLRNLRQRSLDASDENLRHMYQVQYDNTYEELTNKIEQLSKKEQMADVEFISIANGVVVVN